MPDRRMCRGESSTDGVVFAMRRGLKLGVGYRSLPPPKRSRLNVPSGHMHPPLKQLRYRGRRPGQKLDPVESVGSSRSHLMSTRRV